jgi:hypothetical protein
MVSNLDSIFEGEWEPFEEASPPRVRTPRTREDEEDIFAGEWEPLKPPVAEAPVARPPKAKPPQVESPYEVAQRPETQQADAANMGFAEAAFVGGARGITTTMPAQLGATAQFIGETAAAPPPEGFYEGALGKIAKAVDYPGQQAGKALGYIGEKVKNFFEEKGEEWYGARPGPEAGTLTRAAYGGSEMLAPSLVPAGAINTGLRVLSGIGKLSRASKMLAAAGKAEQAAQLMAQANRLASSANKASAAAVAGIFGLSQAQGTVDAALKRADELEKAGDLEGAERMREKARGWQPLATGAIEATGEYFGTKYLSRLFRLNEAEIVKKGAQNVVRDFLKTVGVEVGTEIGQQSGEAAVEKATGIRPEADPLAEALDVVGPTVFMTVLTGGLAGGTTRLARRGEKKAEADQPQDLFAEEEELGFKPTMVQGFINAVKSGEVSLEELEQAETETPSGTPTKKAIRLALDDLRKEEATIRSIDMLEGAAKEPVEEIPPEEAVRAQEEAEQVRFEDLLQQNADEFLAKMEARGRQPFEPARIAEPLEPGYEPIEEGLARKPVEVAAEPVPPEPPEAFPDRLRKEISPRRIPEGRG